MGAGISLKGLRKGGVRGLAILQSHVLKEVLSSLQFLGLDLGIFQDQPQNLRKSKRRVRGNCLHI